MAGFEVAMAEAKKLKGHLERYGIKVSIELQQGRGEWYVTKYLVMNHHTATTKGSNLTPALSICKNGRPDVVGPLCNGYGGYDFIFRIITMGLANHPGLGGPITIDGVHVPQDSMRPPSFGIEWEGGYHTWTAAERDWMAKANKAITAFYGRSIYSQLEHKDWAPTRKVDRNLPMTRAVSISDTSKIQESEDVQASDLPLIAQAVWEYQIQQPVGDTKSPAASYLKWANYNAAQLASGQAKSVVSILQAISKVDVNVDAVVLAQTLAPALLQALNPQQVAEIVADVLGPDIGKQVVDALAAKLATPTNP